MAQSNDDFRTKYRPRRYDQMWQGPDYPALKRLRREEEMIRYPRGLIFCGDYGCGKTTAARIRGMRSSCWNYKEHTIEPCGDCPGCRAAMTRSQGPDYFEMDGTQDRLRSALDYALRKSSIAKHHSHPLIPRVFFVDEAHRASAKMQETLLKDIEDHQQAIFILSTTQPDKLDPAIRKRCTMYRFDPPNLEQVVPRLERVVQSENLTVEPGVLVRIAEVKKCVPRDCLGVLYDLTFESKEITMTRLEDYLGPELEAATPIVAGH
jgi:DNA polymerase-3 subunit gamma/tau